MEHGLNKTIIKMNKLLKSHNDKLNRLVNVSRTRRSNELDFFTDISNKYREFLNYPLEYT